MSHARRLLTLLLGLAGPLLLAPADASAARRDARHHRAHAFAAVYRATPHRPVRHRVHLVQPQRERFAQARRRPLLRGS